MEDRTLKLAAKAIVSGALLGVIFYTIDWAKFLSLLGGVDVVLVLLTIIINAVGVFLSVLKWKYLLDVKGIRWQTVQLHAIYYMGFFFNNFFPSMVGGDLFRIIKTSHAAAERADAICGVLVERASGLVAMLVMTAVAALWNTWHINDVSLGLPWMQISGLTSLVLILLIGSLSISLSPRVRRYFDSYRGFRSILQIRDAFLDYRKYPTILIKVLALSCIFHILLVVNGWLFIKSVGLRPHPTSNNAPLLNSEANQSNISSL